MVDEYFYGSLSLDGSTLNLINDLIDKVDRAKQTVRRSLRRKGRPSSLKSRIGTTPSTLPPIPASDAVEVVSEVSEKSDSRRPSFKHSSSDINLRPTTLDTTGNGNNGQPIAPVQHFEPRGFRWGNNLMFYNCLQLIDK